jgi:hypothetical protein
MLVYKYFIELAEIIVNFPVINKQQNDTSPYWEILYNNLEKIPSIYSFIQNKDDEVVLTKDFIRTFKSYIESLPDTKSKKMRVFKFFNNLYEALRISDSPAKMYDVLDTYKEENGNRLFTTYTFRHDFDKARAISIGFTDAEIGAIDECLLGKKIGFSEFIKLLEEKTKKEEIVDSLVENPNYNCRFDYGIYPGLKPSKVKPAQFKPLDPMKIDPKIQHQIIRGEDVRGFVEIPPKQFLPGQYLQFNPVAKGKDNKQEEEFIIYSEDPYVDTSYTRNLIAGSIIATPDLEAFKQKYETAGRLTYDYFELYKESADAPDGSKITWVLYSVVPKVGYIYTHPIAQGVEEYRRPRIFTDTQRWQDLPDEGGNKRYELVASGGSPAPAPEPKPPAPEPKPPAPEPKPPAPEPIPVRSIQDVPKEVIDAWQNKETTYLSWNILKTINKIPQPEWESKSLDEWPPIQVKRSKNIVGESHVNNIVYSKDKPELPLNSNLEFIKLNAFENLWIVSPMPNYEHYTEYHPDYLKRDPRIDTEQYEWEVDLYIGRRLKVVKKSSAPPQPPLPPPSPPLPPPSPPLPPPSPPLPPPSPPADEVEEKFSWKDIDLAIPTDEASKFKVYYDTDTGRYISTTNLDARTQFTIQYLDDSTLKFLSTSQSLIPIPVDAIWTDMPDGPRTKVYQMVAKKGATFEMNGPGLPAFESNEKNLQFFRSNILLPPTVKGVVWNIEKKQRGTENGLLLSGTPSQWLLTAVSKDAGAAAPAPSKGGARTRRRHLKISYTRRHRQTR